MLTVRLQNMPQDRSLLEQDLDILAQASNAFFSCFVRF